METLHILNGECLRDYLSKYLENKIYICFNECFIDGKVTEQIFSQQFLTIRANGLYDYYGVPHEVYYQKTKTELSKLLEEKYKQIILWFDEAVWKVWTRGFVAVGR